jgi:hypothetical protein
LHPMRNGGEDVSHTPGPWTVITVQAEPDYFAAVDGPVIEPEWSFALQIADGIRVRANARLIAAAPDLLAALETLLDNGDDPHPLSGRDPTVRREDIGPARAAIAKATRASE